ncbi:MAG: hypothetical protein ACTSVA_04215 [Candidatus Njordarchaeales archaeon]
MSKLRIALKIIVYLLSITLSIFSALIGYDAYNLASQGIIVGKSSTVQGTEYVNISVPITIRVPGYFFDLSRINITIIIIDEKNHQYARDCELIPYIPLSGEKNITIELSLPITVAQQWVNGSITLYSKFIIRFWFSKYNYDFLGFGIAGRSELQRE